LPPSRPQIVRACAASPWARSAPGLLLHALYLALMGLVGLAIATRRIGHLLLK
jgi:hypothetical protein